MKLRLSSILVAVLFAAAAQSHSQIKLKLVTPYNYNCGRVSSPLYCYGAPLNDATGAGAGTFWLDTNLARNTGFVLWYGKIGFLGHSKTIKTEVLAKNEQRLPVSIRIKFAGVTTTGQKYTGTLTNSISYYYSSGGGGKGGAGAGWRFFIDKGSLISITFP
jgi:hypothetical protein